MTTTLVDRRLAFEKVYVEPYGDVHKNAIAFHLLF